MITVCLYPMALIAAILAVFVGFLSTTPIPAGTLFAVVVPLVNGVLPAVIFGEPAKASLSVPPVPDSLEPASRPQGEIFRELPSGARMPANGLGMCCRHSAYDTESVRRTVLWFLLKGGRLIDTAQLYLNHRGVGLGIRDAVARGVPRSEIFVTTKLTPQFYSGSAPAEQVPVWLEELGLEYIDLVLLHHPEGLPFSKCASGTPVECRANAWSQLSEVQKTGVVKDLGVSNFNVRQINELGGVEGGAPVAVNQIQYNAFAPHRQDVLVEECQAQGVAVTAWSSFQGTMMQHAGMFQQDTLKEIAATKGRSVPQVLLRWALQKGVAVIPGTGNPEHMDTNLAAYGFKLSEAEMKTISSIKTDPTADFPSTGFEVNDS